MNTALQWARDTFGEAELGDVRRTDRLVRLAEAAASRPAGHVTRVCRDSAEREGAYRFLERGRFDPNELCRAVGQHAARASRGESVIHVAVDQTTITIVDRMKTKDIGRTRYNESHRQGLQVMNALAMTEQGVAIGLVAQNWWRRPKQMSPDYETDQRPDDERESVLWRRALTMSLQSLAAVGSKARPWFQLDRGADANHVLRWANEHRDEADVTIRGSYERRLRGGNRLRKTVLKRRLDGMVHIAVPARRGLGRSRRFRSARCGVRYASVTVELDRVKSRANPIELSVIHVCEHHRHKHNRIEWWLLTTREVRSFRGALEVVRAYSHRWRIEELHRTWKSGHCDVESSQLRSEQPLRVWATILSAVAARIERLKHLSRNEPDLLASTELSRDEIDAAIILSRTKKHKQGDDLTIGEAVVLIAQLGGYAGRPNKSPPGSQVLGRGFVRVLDAADVLVVARGSG